MAEQSLKIPITGSAKQALVFANTPSFLMQRLQGDPMVQYAHQMLTPETLFEILKKLVIPDGRVAGTIIGTICSMTRIVHRGLAPALG